MYSPNRASPPPSPPPLAPIAEQESSDVPSEGRTPQISEELRAYGETVPPHDSMLEVRAIPAEATLEDSVADEETSAKRIIFPITPFYRRKGGCSKCNIWLGLLVVLFLLLSIGLFLVWAITSDGFRNLGGISTVCNSKQCINTAFRWTTYMDDSILPCENFYRFSCNRYHSLDSDKQLSFTDQQTEKTSRTVYGLLSSEPGNGLRSERLAKSLFSSCMDGPQRAKVGSASLYDVMRNLPCGPIFLDCSFNQDVYSWERHSGMLDWDAGDWNLIVTGRDVHPTDKSKLVLQLRPPNIEPLLDPFRTELIRLAQPSANEIDPLLQLSLRQNLLNVVASRQLMRDPSEVAGALDEVALLLIELNRASTTSSFVAPNTTYMTITELKTAIPQINVSEFLNAQLSSVYIWGEDDVIAIKDLNYFIQLGFLMSRTPRATVANYLVAVTALHLRQYANYPTTQFSWRDCVAQLSGLEPVEKMYIVQNSDFTTEKISKFLATLKDDFLSTHRQHPLQYLSEINRISFLVGYPRRRSNEDLVWKPFSNFAMNQSDYFLSVTNAWKTQKNYEMSQIGTYMDMDDAPYYPVLTPTILYEAQLASLILPLSFLQGPISLPGENTPWYTVYGSLAVTVQQMISKVFWYRMDATTAKQCLGDIYRSFLDSTFRTSLDIDVDLSKTIEFADGLRTASFGYLRWQTENMNYEEKSLPAYEQYNSIQNMFINYGTLACSAEGSQPGSEYEAMMNTAVTNARVFSMHFHCTNTSSIFNRRVCV